MNTIFQLIPPVELTGKAGYIGKDQNAVLHLFHNIMCTASCRVVTKISSCPVNTTSGRGIKQLGISFGSSFLLFSFESSRGKSAALTS